MHLDRTMHVYVYPRPLLKTILCTCLNTQRLINYRIQTSLCASILGRLYFVPASTYCKFFVTPHVVVNQLVDNQSQ